MPVAALSLESTIQS